MFLTLGEWEIATRGEILAGDRSAFVGGEMVGGLTIDSRTIRRGQWFIALKGKEGRDGHMFVEAAIKAGAGGIIVSDRELWEKILYPIHSDLPSLFVHDTTEALADAARAILDKFAPFVIAITGTVGKTSVKEAVAHIAGSKWPALKNPLNWNTEIGVPLSVFDLNKKHRVAVLECASRGKGQIRHLSLIARPHVACITAIGPGHLSEFGTVDEVASAKWEILDGLRKGGSVVAPGESEYTKSYAGNVDTITFGTAKTNDIHPLEIKIGNTETRFDIRTPEGAFETIIPGITKADILNALAAVACAMKINVEGQTLTLDEIAESLKTVPGVPGRTEIITRPNGIEVIFDAYNSNPLSLKNAIDALCNRTKLSDGSEILRRVAILGDMLELGDDAVIYHRDAGRRIAELPIDCLITAGELAGEIRNEAERARNRIIDGGHYLNTDILSIELGNFLHPGDLVLIKASRALEFEKLLKGDW